MDNNTDMNKPIEIICEEHGSFWITPNDHIGNNKEKIAYGCFKCGDKKLIKKGKK